GLNFTACNNVILLELWWNPAVEEQAFDRIHWIGQLLPVNIYKLVVQDTVEEARRKLSFLDHGKVAKEFRRLAKHYLCTYSLL
ncbi:hypothetical protein EDD16DRAFT_1502780, partial [Pisolithus croceorrhizus]